MSTIDGYAQEREMRSAKRMFVCFRRLIPALLFPLGHLFSQTVTLEGIVSDSQTGERLVNANVVLKGTSLGTTTEFGNPDAKHREPNSKWAD